MILKERTSWRYVALRPKRFPELTRSVGSAARELRKVLNGGDETTECKERENTTTVES